MKTKTHFTFRIDLWDDTGSEIVEHVAAVDDFEIATATYTAAVEAMARSAHHHAAGSARGEGYRAAAVISFTISRKRSTQFLQLSTNW